MNGSKGRRPWRRSRRQRLLVGSGAKPRRLLPPGHPLITQARTDAQQHRGRVLGCDGAASGQPIGQIGIGAFQQSLQRLDIRVGQGTKVVANEATNQQVVFLRSAVRGAE